MEAKESIFGVKKRQFRSGGGGDCVCVCGEVGFKFCFKTCVPQVKKIKNWGVHKNLVNKKVVDVKRKVKQVKFSLLFSFEISSLQFVIF